MSMKRTLVVTYKDPPLDVTIDYSFIDWQLEQAVSRMEFVAEVEMHYEDMLERGED